ncbi:hypothetical protein [Chlorobium limicola]|uniref:hypothetical protein n=1 Tax=Chlorobium limicola TaxID=1092 RepID=UPI00128F25D0|nr:hypothetical protein [Chlorobium limicola]
MLDGSCVLSFHAGGSVNHVRFAILSPGLDAIKSRIIWANGKPCHFSAVSATNDMPAYLMNGPMNVDAEEGLQHYPIVKDIDPRQCGRSTSVFSAFCLSQDIDRCFFA